MPDPSRGEVANKMAAPDAHGPHCAPASQRGHEECGWKPGGFYSGLDGFPGPSDQPDYYAFLANVGSLMQKSGVDIIVAHHTEKGLVGAVVFFADMAHYGSGGTATQEADASGFRLLALDPAARGLGIGRKLSEACIARTKALRKSQVVIHTTAPMQVAWKMYERLGFERSTDLDFVQEDLPVFGFRLGLGSDIPEERHA